MFLVAHVMGGWAVMNALDGTSHPRKNIALNKKNSSHILSSKLVC